MPCRPAKRTAATKTLASSQDVTSCYKYQLFQWGWPLTDALVFNIPLGASSPVEPDPWFLPSNYKSASHLGVESGLFTRSCVQTFEPTPRVNKAPVLWGWDEGLE